MFYQLWEHLERQKHIHSRHFLPDSVKPATKIQRIYFLNTTVHCAFLNLILYSPAAFYGMSASSDSGWKTDRSECFVVPNAPTVDKTWSYDVFRPPPMQEPGRTRRHPPHYLEPNLACSSSAGPPQQPRSVRSPMCAGKSRLEMT